KACVLPENPASYRVVRTKSYLFNKALAKSNNGEYASIVDRFAANLLPSQGGGAGPC
ncbi:transcriptional regulator LeuO, partial [Klebsiella pneumoniae]